MIWNGKRYPGVQVHRDMEDKTYLVVRRDFDCGRTRPTVDVYAPMFVGQQDSMTTCSASWEWLAQSTYPVSQRKLSEDMQCFLTPFVTDAA